jgi:hypothetical protein
MRQQVPLAQSTRLLFATFLAPDSACYDAIARVHVVPYHDPAHRVVIDCLLGGFAIGPHLGLHASVHAIRTCEQQLRKGAHAADLALFRPDGTLVGWLELTPAHVASGQRVAPRATRGPLIEGIQTTRKARGHDSRARRTKLRHRRTARQTREAQRTQVYHPMPTVYHEGVRA